MSGATDEYGLCVVCGGHGGTMTEPAEPDGKWGWRRCEVCDGKDRVTPLIEAQAETSWDDRELS